MNAHSKTSAPSAGAIRIALSKINIRDDLAVRYGNLSEQHVHDLRQAIKRGSKFPPLLVWQETDEDGTTTGRFVLLDGRHRLAALRGEKQELAEVSAEVIHGTRQQAIAEAADRNTKIALPLTRWEATNAAWAVVRAMPAGGGMSKAQIARKCGVADRTVAIMRARWKAWPEEQQPSGDWQRDKRDAEGKQEEPMDDDEYMRQRAEMIEKTAKAIRAAVGKLPEIDSNAFAEAIARIMGHRTAYLVDYLRGTPDDGEEMPWTGLRGDDDPNAEPEF